VAVHEFSYYFRLVWVHLVTRGGAVCGPNLTTVRKGFNLRGPGAVSAGVITGDEILNPLFAKLGLTDELEVDGVVITFPFHAEFAGLL